MDEQDKITPAEQTVIEAKEAVIQADRTVIQAKESVIREKENSTSSSVGNAGNVAHADVVTNSEKTADASVVRHADNIENVVVQGEPLRTPRARKLNYVRDIARSFTIIFALLVTVIVIIDKNHNENNLQGQLRDFQNSRTNSDKITADKLECNRRYQDLVALHNEQQLILIGEFLVTITRIAPGEERTAAAQEITEELDKVNISARKALTLKIDYNNEGSPLPCPLELEAPEPLPDPAEVIPTATLPLVTETSIVPVTPTT